MKEFYDLHHKQVMQFCEPWFFQKNNGSLKEIRCPWFAFEFVLNQTTAISDKEVLLAFFQERCKNMGSFLVSFEIANGTKA